MKVDDFPFDNFMVINKVTRPSYTVENNKVDISREDGTRLLHTRLKEGTITVECTLVSDEANDFMRVQDLDELIKKRLNTKGDLRIVFSDFPDRYWVGRLDGEDAIDIITEKLGTLTLHFLIPEGISHSLYSTISTNFEPGAGDENLVLDPEFKNLEKYWMPYAYRDEETYEGSNVLFAVLDETNDTLYPKEWNYLAVSNINRRRVNVKKGDSISAGCWVKLNSFNEGDTTGENSFQLSIEEFEVVGQARIAVGSYPVKVTSLGEWTFLKIENYKIQFASTKYLLLQPFIRGKASVEISKLQMNLGATLKPYAEDGKHLLETIPLPYTGTYPSYPLITATFDGEAGFVAFINSKGGVLQFGNPEDSDIQSGVRSDKIINYSFYGNSPKTNLILNGGGTTHYPNYLSNTNTPNKVQGSITYTKAIHVMNPIFINDSTKVWHGPRVWQSIDKNYANSNTGDFQWVNRLDFGTNAKNQMGRMEFFLFDENKKVVMGGVVRDSNANKEEIIVEFHNSQKIVKSVALNRKKFNGHWHEFKFRRQGDNLLWDFGQVKSVTNTNAAVRSVVEAYQLREAGQSARQVTGMSVWFEKLGNSPIPKYFDWTDSNFTWINTPTWSNIPNVISDGDVLQIDVQKKQLLLNGVIENGTEFHTIDNQWSQFLIDQSYGEMQVVTNEWANVPEVSVEYQEAFK